MAGKKQSARKAAATATVDAKDSSSTSTTNSDRSIVFFHPDLGIGGAERLVVDAAVGLQERGNRVVIFTNHCDPGHCFDECRDGTLDVRVRGAWLIPMSLASRLTILCAILRHIHLLLHIAITGELRALRPRAFIVDQLSAGLPLLRYLVPTVPVLFYCHFPDLLLAQGRSSALKRLYRVPFDRIEQWSMGFAQVVAVNSLFTRGVVEKTWPRLKSQVHLKVVYPCVDTEAKENELQGDVGSVLEDGQKVILSINRFERKKDIGLAIKAFAAIPEEERNDVRLVLAGGYDLRVSENVLYHTELQTLASSLGLAHHTITPNSNTATALAAVPPTTQVLFLLSVPNALKTALLRSARLLVYTPSNEHFGIVPLEAMLARVPVLAANTGGPVETVQDGETGWLCSPEDVPAWSEVMRLALGLKDKEVKKMGELGAQRVRDGFGRSSMAARFESIVADITSQRIAASRGSGMLSTLLLTLLFAVSIGVGKLLSYLR